MEDTHDFNIEGTAADEQAKPVKLECNFCGKFEQDVLLLIAGPRGVFICNECIELMVDIIRGTVPDFCMTVV